MIAKCIFWGRFPRNYSLILLASIWCQFSLELIAFPFDIVGLAPGMELQILFPVQSLQESIGNMVLFCCCTCSFLSLYLEMYVR